MSREEFNLYMERQHGLYQRVHGIKARHRLITRLMMERNLDRTSIMKLALYRLGGYMSRAAVRKMDIREVVEELETRVPDSFPDFATFGVERRRRPPRA